MVSCTYIVNVSFMIQVQKEIWSLRRKRANDRDASLSHASGFRLTLNLAFTTTKWLWHEESLE